MTAMSYYRLQNASQGIVGPIKIGTLKDLAEAGIIQRDVLVSRDDGPFLSLQAFPEVVEAVKEHLPPGPEPSYAGDLGVVSFLRVFHRLHDAKGTGLLSVRDGTRRKDVYMEGGEPVFVTSTTVKERLGEALVARRKIDREQLKTGLEKAKTQKLSLGEALVRMGLLTEVDLMAELRDQQMSRLVDLCCWEHGRYGYFTDKKYEGKRCDLGLITRELALRAAREIAEKTVLLRLGDHLHQVPERVSSRAVDACLTGLSSDERRALDSIDGKGTAVSIVTSDAARRRAALTVLYLLWEIGGVVFKPKRA